MEPKPFNRKTILIVDDAPFIVAEMEEMLLPHFEVRSANSGREALESARRTPVPDLILLDMVLPDLNGLVVQAHLRDDPVTAGIPIVFVTAADAVDDIERGLRGGAADYITKPLVVDDLIARCQRVVAAAGSAADPTRGRVAPAQSLP